jgi:hypothetical protein
VARPPKEKAIHVWVWPYAFSDNERFPARGREVLEQAQIGICFPENAGFSLESALDQSNQFHDFSIIGEPVSFDLLFRENHRAVALNIEDSSCPFYQADSRIGISFLHFRFHPGSLREEVSTDAVRDRDLHISSFSDFVAGS